LLPQIEWFLMNFDRLLTAKMGRIWAYLIGLLGFGLRLYQLGQESMWYDEILQLDIAQRSINDLFVALPSHAAVPLDYLTSHFWIMLGREDYWVRLPAALLGTITLALAYPLGRTLGGDRRAGLLFMVLLATSPFHLRYSQEVRPYAYVLLGVMLAGYGWWRLRLRGGWPNWLALQLGGLLFSLAHFFAIVIFAAWGLVALVDLIFNRRRIAAVRALSALLVSGLSVLIILLYLGWGTTFVRVGSLFSQTLVEPARFTIEASQKPNLAAGPTISETFIKRDILKPVTGTQSEGDLLFFVALPLFGLIELVRRRAFTVSLLLTLWLCLPVLTVVAFLKHRGEFFAARYIISILPAYLLLLTVGMLALPRWLKQSGRPGLAWLTLLLLSGLVVSRYGQELSRYYTFEDKENWRLAIQLVAQNAGPEDAVIPVNAEGAVRWYYPPAGVAGHPYNNFEAIKATITQAERSWVIMSVFAAFIDQGDQVLKVWLSEQGAIRLQLGPVMSVYYVGPQATADQLLDEIQAFALPRDHALYASLARENRLRPAVARKYLELAIQYAPDEASRARYQADLAVYQR
jgi:uncharacterized membrane protein